MKLIKVKTKDGRYGTVIGQVDHSSPWYWIFFNKFDAKYYHEKNLTKL